MLTDGLQAWLNGVQGMLAFSIVGEQMRTLIIGDVHGCKDELQEMLAKFGHVRGKDRLFQTGDMINRGPDSLGAVELAQAVGIQSVLGNHEARLCSIMQKQPFERSLKDLRFLERLGESTDAVYEIVKDWPLWIDEDHFLVVHAGLEPGKTRLEDMRRKILLSIRTWDGVGEEMDRLGDPAWFDCIQWPKTVVFGHWALGGLVIRNGLRGLDTGCVYGKFLSAWCPEENHIYQVPARKEYSPLVPGVIQ